MYQHVQFPLTDVLKLYPVYKPAMPARTIPAFERGIIIVQYDCFKAFLCGYAVKWRVL